MASIATAAPGMPSSSAVPECNLREEGLQVSHINALRRHGVLALRNVLDQRELAALQQAADELIEWAWRTGEHPDMLWKIPPGSDGIAPIRIEYVIDKSDAVRLLAGHPLLLRVAEALVGPNMIPTWDSMVFKTNRGAPRVAWHRDAPIYEDPMPLVGGGRIVNLGTYLNPATQETCIWYVPGSNYWSDEKIATAMEQRNAAEWDVEEAIPALMEPGDVLVHDIMTLHGAPAVTDKQRRAIYFEYRPGEIEWQLGPHNREYIALKQQVLCACIAARTESAWGVGEEPFDYQPAADYRLWEGRPGLITYRYPHGEYWVGPATGCSPETG
jgi:phytanoyl-CoA hydroxylase